MICVVDCLWSPTPSSSHDHNLARVDLKLHLYEPVVSERDFYSVVTPCACDLHLKCNRSADTVVQRTRPLLLSLLASILRLSAHIKHFVSSQECQNRKNHTALKNANFDEQDGVISQLFRAETLETIPSARAIMQSLVLIQIEMLDSKILSILCLIISDDAYKLHDSRARFLYLIIGTMHRCTAPSTGHLKFVCNTLL